jgi:hypothetical protein
MGSFPGSVSDAGYCPVREIACYFADWTLARGPNVMLLQKIFKLVGTKVREDQITGDKGRSRSLSRNGDEFIKSPAIFADLDALVFITALVQVLFGRHTPWASNLNV